MIQEDKLYSKQNTQHEELRTFYVLIDFEE